MRLGGAVLAVGVAVVTVSSGSAVSAASRPSLIAYASRSGGVWIVQDGHPGSAKAISAGAAAPSWSPNGETLAFALDREYIAIANRSGHIIAKLKAPVTDGLDWSPNGKEIAYICTAGHILSIQYPSPTPPVQFGPETWPNLCVLNVVTGENRVVMHSTTKDAVVANVSWSSSSDEVAVDSQTHINTGDYCVNFHLSTTPNPDPTGPGCDEPYISLVDVSTGKAEPVGKEFMSQPAFSPDGREIAFNDTTQPSPNQRLGIMSAGGGDVRDIVTLYKDASSFSALIAPSPNWSPNGKELVFASYNLQSDDGSEGLYSVTVHGEDLKKVTGFSIYATQWVSSPSWTQPLSRCSVPKLKGQKLAAAKRLVGLAGCTVGSISGPKKDRGKRHVVSQHPAAGKDVALGTKVNIQVH
jgi:Tol biopolymer transport system component